MNATLVLIVGLLIFFSAHAVRIVADDWRSAMISRIGGLGWKGLIGSISLLGFVLIAWGYGQARIEPVALWTPPLWTRHLTMLLMLPAFILLLAPYVPGNRLKSVLGHPMVAGTALWALAHLLANGMLADLLLFGGFLAWSLLSFTASRQRDRAEGKTYPAGPASRTLLVVVAGMVVWAVFAKLLHGPLIGVSLFN